MGYVRDEELFTPGVSAREVDFADGETISIRLTLKVPSVTIVIYPYGTPAGTSSQGYHPAFLDTGSYPTPLATLTNVGDSYSPTERVWVEPGFPAGPRNFPSLSRATVRRTQP